MNKIYKIINRVLTGQVVVVSELAKSVSHSSITLFSSKSLKGNTIKVVSGTISGSVFGGITDDDQEVSGNSVTVSQADRLTSLSTVAIAVAQVMS